MAADDLAGLQVPEDELIPSTTFKPIAAPDKLHGTGLPNADALKANPMLGAEDIMRLFIASKVPITLWGPVGAGKTKTIQAFANEEDENGVPYRVETIQPSTEDPTSLHGLMFNDYDPTEGKTMMKRSIPDVAWSVWEAYATKRQLTVMFLDEMTTCMPAQQNALLGLLTDGTYGDMDISPYVTFVMAANPPGTVSTCLDLSEAVINRGGHIPWYGDVGPFLDKWESGFGYDSRRPAEDTVWAVRNLASKAEGQIFRDLNFDPETGEIEEDRWTVDALCPYGQMQPSPRALTEFAKMHETINKTFNESPDSIRHFYIEECCKALLGPPMAKYMAEVNKEELTRLSPKKVFDKVRLAGVKNTWTTDELYDNLGDSLFKIGNNYMSKSEAIEMLSLMYKELWIEVNPSENGDRSRIIDTSVLLAAWSMFVTAPNEEVQKAMSSQMLEFVIDANKMFKNKQLSRTTVLPRFVTDEARRLIQAYAS